MPRTSLASLSPPRFRAAAEPATPPASLRASFDGPQPALPGSARLTVLGLGIAGVMPPLAFTAHSGQLGLIGGVPVSIALTGLLILAPALVCLVAALVGLDGVRESFRVRGDKEHEQAVLRVFVAALAVVYGFVGEAAVTSGEFAPACQIVAALGLAGAWGFLLLTILDPVPSPSRYYLGAVFDAALLSAFLHWGAMLTAPWFPVYLLATFYAGFRFGPAALAVVSIANLVGFAAVVAATPFWHEEALLAGGLVIAMIVLPAYVGSMVREVAESRAAAAAAQAARTRFLMVISQALRAPLDAMLGSAADRRAGEREPETLAMAPSARALLSQVNNILDFSALEAGAFVPAVEAFDLHRVVNETLAERRAEAAARGLRLRVHIDPALPYRLRGWPQQLAQILDYLVARALEVTGAGVVRVAIDASGGNGNTIHLRLAVRDEGMPIPEIDAEKLFDPFAGAAAARSAPSAHGAFGLAVVKRLVELMGGQIVVDSGGGAARGGAFTITVPLDVDEPAVESDIDLGNCLVLIATEDSQFASEIAEPLNAWHGDPRWIEGFEGTLDFAERRDDKACSALIVDGRTHVLAALSFAHRAVSGPAAPSFVLIVAEASQIDRLVELADGELDGVLAAPLDTQLLANALHALPLWQGVAPRPVMVAPTTEAAQASEAPPAPVVVPPPPVAPPPPIVAEPLAVAEPLYVAEPLPVAEPPTVFAPPLPAAAVATPQVTQIAMHPRFGAETPVVDPRAIAALRGLGEGDAFLAEIIDSFRTEIKEIMHRIVRTAAGADAAGFARALHALRSCAANLGGVRLNELLLSLREVTTDELREQGSLVVQRVGDELARLDAALLEFLPDRVARREA